MLSTILRRARQISRRLHVRVILFAVLNLVALALAKLISPIVPDWLGDRIGAEAVDPILSIIASSMLAVTTFSLTIMMAGLHRASSQWTPRSHLILREDTVTQSVLSNFLGAYLFALVAIILRAADVFDHRDIVVLFGMTLVVVALIVVSFIRWILHLEGLGSLPETAEQIEDKATDSLQRIASHPCKGANPLTDPNTQIPQDALMITAPQHGYIPQLFEEALQKLASDNDLRIYLVTSVGRYLHKGDPLAFVSTPSGALDDGLKDDITECVQISDLRSFEQDPVFGVAVMAEIATRALSPGINDPGTAIDVVYRLGHLVSLAAPQGVDVPEVKYDRLWVPPLDLAELFNTSFDPICRCAGDAVEVHLALQNALSGVITHAAPELSKEAWKMADICRARAETMISFPADIARLREVAVTRQADTD
ncbi:DUF2254 domain-containing protein [Primorskyibacter flagellatus]|uniref:Uncharacterized membrane protein n=1 Tax=Primorskyibacter flagellatus TaxID=1387277 RepID=A0A1W1Z522_9RHOB|nr:DUF2254 domain-containing protein [Primorskyibacter flagellatus]SMC43567.1 Uncharacterized membrane protein [Primorskyibacter flagellatus]